jgi:hypothetical protein
VLHDDGRVLVPRDFFGELARRKDVRGESLRVLFHLVAIASPRDEAGASAEEIGRALGLQRPNVCRALRQLRRLSVVRDAGRD